MKHLQVAGEAGDFIAVAVVGAADLLSIWCRLPHCCAAAFFFYSNVSRMLCYVISLTLHYVVVCCARI